MAPQASIPLAADVLGTIGTVFGVYRIWKNWRNGSTEGVTGLMFMIWASACPSFGAYAIIQRFNTPLQIQPNILCALCLIGWGQTLYYHNHLRIWKVLLLTLSITCFAAGLEFSLVFAIRKPYERGLEWPVTLIGSFATSMLIIGLIPPYFELAKRGGRVVGISFKFLAIDIAGAIFSLLALAVQHSFDILGGILYILAMVMELGIIGSHLIWMFRTRHDHNVPREDERSIGEPMKISRNYVTWYKSLDSRQLLRYNQPEGEKYFFASHLADREVVKRPETAAYCSKGGEFF